MNSPTATADSVNHLVVSPRLSSVAPIAATVARGGVSRHRPGADSPGVIRARSGCDNRFLIEASESAHTNGDVVVTKLLVPAARAGVPRDELRAELDRGAAARLTLVCAPTGWGKSSLLAGWARAGGTPVAWVSLDAADGDPARFFSHVVAALERTLDGYRSAIVPLLGAPDIALREEVLPLLVNELSERGERFALVLDDLQAVRSDAVHGGLEYLVARLPPFAQLVVSTQVRPPLRLGRLRALGEVVEIGSDRLAFGEREAAELLNELEGLELGEQDVSTIVRRTEGWPAGLQLAALSLRSRPDRGPVGAVLPIDYRHLVAYLWDDVVARQPAAIREFLLRTSILERLSAPLCDAVRCADDSQQMLERLAHENLFLIGLDDQREFFRYHDLFRELLRRQLARRATAAELAELHRRARAWHAERDDVRGTIEHALAGGDHGEAAELIARHWIDVYNAGRAVTLDRWLAALPEQAVRGSSQLCLVRAMLAGLLGRSGEVEDWVAAAEASGDDGQLHWLGGSVASSAEMVRMRHSLWSGDGAAALAHARRAAELEAGRDARSRAFADTTLGEGLFWAGERERARAPLRRAIEQAAEVGWIGQELVARSLHALVADLADTEREARLALSLAERHGRLEHAYTALPQIALGVALRERGELAEADASLERGLTLSRRGGQTAFCALAAIELAALRAAQGDREAAGELLARARREVDVAGIAALAARAAELDVRPATRSPRSPAGGDLSASELRVLRLFAGPLTYREIAAELYLSHSTVRTHARHIREKLGASSRAESIELARRAGYL